VLLVTYKLIKYFISSNTSDYNISTFSYLHLASASFPQFGTFSRLNKKQKHSKTKENKDCIALAGRWREEARAVVQK